MAVNVRVPDWSSCRRVVIYTPIIMGMPIGQWSGSDATQGLQHTIIQLNKDTTRQTETMIRLTWAILALTGVMLLAVVAQILLTLKQMQWI
jgi:hypothetical protein